MAATQEIQTEVQDRLSSLGFAFNPFDGLEASNDPNISSYLIGHDMFSVAWEAAPAALFAPAGGGKTAMRIYTMHACWKYEGQRRKFPVSYDLPSFVNLPELTSLEAHESAIAIAIATDVFLTCAYRPDLYLSITAPRRMKLLSLLRLLLPTSLEYILGILTESGDVGQLSDHLDRTYRLPDPPNAEAAIGLGKIMLQDLNDTSSSIQFSSAEFETLLTFIQDDLKFESILLLLDGVDGDGTRSGNAQAQLNIIAPILEQSLEWAKRNVFLKAFLPIELDAFPVAQIENFYNESLQAEIRWDAPKLAEILRRRVYVASQGRFGSMDALSSPALRDVETLVASRARPLPRETIRLANFMLQNYLEREGEYIEPEDITQAEQKYLQQSIFPD